MRASPVSMVVNSKPSNIYVLYAPCVMPFFARTPDISIHYEEFGDPAAFPVLLFAPGLMRSTITRWEHMDLVPRKVLGNAYRVIAMDQRNAGESKAPITATDTWADYASDAIGLIDHLGLDAPGVLGPLYRPVLRHESTRAHGTRVHQSHGPGRPRPYRPHRHQSRPLHARLLPVGRGIT